MTMVARTNRRKLMTALVAAGLALNVAATTQAVSSEPDEVAVPEAATDTAPLETHDGDAPRDQERTRRIVALSPADALSATGNSKPPDYIFGWLWGTTRGRGSFANTAIGGGITNGYAGSRDKNAYRGFSGYRGASRPFATFGNGAGNRGVRGRGGLSRSRGVRTISGGRRGHVSRGGHGTASGVSQGQPATAEAALVGTSFSMDFFSSSAFSFRSAAHRFGTVAVSANFTNLSIIRGPTRDGIFRTFTGAVAGSGDFTGNTRFAGVFSPGLSPALVTMGNVIFDSTNTLLIELGGLVRGTEYDAIDATTVALGGTLDIDLIALVPGDPVFVPQLGDVFDIIIAESITGAFATVLPPALPGGMYLDLSIVQASTRAADILRLTVSQGLRLTVSQGTTVAEPATLILLGFGLAGLGLVRRRRAV